MRPYKTVEEVEAVFGRTVRHGLYSGMITGAVMRTRDCVMIYIGVDCVVTAESALELFMFADGTQVGVTE